MKLTTVGAERTVPALSPTRLDLVHLLRASRRELLLLVPTLPRPAMLTMSCS